MGRSSQSDKYLRRRGENWHYYRRVRSKFQAFDGRGTIRLSLGTSSLETARLRRDELASADEEYWASLALADASVSDVAGVDPRIAEQRYRAACAAAMTAGFRYRPMDRQVQPGNVEEVVERLLALKSNPKSDAPLEPFRARPLRRAVHGLQ